MRPLLHTWSLAVEEQYYIFAPILLYIVYRFLGRRWLLVLVPILIVSFAGAVVAASVAPTAGFYLLPTRVWELMLGAVLMLRRPPTLTNQALAEVVGVIGVVLIGVGFFTIAEGDPFPSFNALYPCAGAALLIYAGQDGGASRRPTLATRLLMLRPMVWIGLISYSLYLVHWPISAFVRHLRLEEIDLSTAVLMFAASLALAAFSWRFIEQPFRRPHSFSGLRPVFAMSATAIAAMAVVGVAGISRDGFPERFPDLAIAPIKVGDWHWGTCFNCGADPLEAWSARDCTRTTGFAPKVLLWGDSFAAHYVTGLETNAARIGADILQYTYAGCPPILSYFSYARVDCTTFNRRALEIVAEEGIDAVILSARWTDYEARGFSGLQETVDALTALGVETYVIGQSPQFVADVRKINYFAQRNGADDGTWPMAMDPAIAARVKRYTVGATFIDPLPSLCDGTVCRYRNDEGFLYFDYGHFSQAGAIRAVALYWPTFAVRMSAH